MKIHKQKSQMDYVGNTKCGLTVDPAYTSIFYCGVTCNRCLKIRNKSRKGEGGTK